MGAAAFIIVLGMLASILDYPNLGAITILSGFIILALLIKL